MDRLLVIDGNYYLHRVFFTLKTSRPIEEVLPYNFLGLILKDACAIKATHILVAFDGPAIFRYEVYKDYKVDRRNSKVNNDDEAEGSKDIYVYLPAVRQLLDKCGIVWQQKKKYEADDVLASAMVQLSSPEVQVIGGTGDKDVYQSLLANCKIYASAFKPPVFITPEKAVKRKGVPIEGMVMYQTLLGDATDSVPQILSPVKAKNAVLKWKTFKNWFAKGSKEDKRWLFANQAKLTINRKLVELVTDLSLPSLPELKVPKKQIQGMPKPWYAYQDLIHPKSKGLFRR